MPNFEPAVRIFDEDAEVFVRYEDFLELPIQVVDPSSGNVIDGSLAEFIDGFNDIQASFDTQEEVDEDTL